MGLRTEPNRPTLPAIIVDCRLSPSRTMWLVIPAVDTVVGLVPAAFWRVREPEPPVPLPTSESSQRAGVVPSFGQITAGLCGPRWSGPRA